MPAGNATPESDELSDFSNEIKTGLGQKLNDLGDQLAQIRLAGDIPTGDSPPEIPKERPPTSRERTGALKAAAREVAKGIAFNTLVFKAPWILAHLVVVETYNDEPKTLQELKSAVLTYRPGTDVHHIVLRSNTQFSPGQINSLENLVRIPRMKHHDINRWYETRNPEFGWETPREYLSGRSWDVQYAVGLEALEDAGVLKR